MSNNPSVVSVREVTPTMGRSHSGSSNKTRALPALIGHLPTREEVRRSLCSKTSVPNRVGVGVVTNLD